MKKSKLYWKNIKKNLSRQFCPNVSLHRFIGEANFRYNNKNILEIGFGHGADLLECKKRGGKVYGLDINTNFVKSLKKKIFNVKNIDCSKEKIPFKKKFDLIYHRDTICYFSDKEILFLQKNIFEKLKINGIHVFQYIEDDYQKLDKAKLKLNNFNINISKNFRKKKFAEKLNPIRFLKFKNLLKLNQKIGFFLVGKKILIESYGLKENKLRLNRYLMFKKNEFSNV